MQNLYKIATLEHILVAVAGATRSKQKALTGFLHIFRNYAYYFLYF